jgi:hypothetical protein
MRTWPTYAYIPAPYSSTSTGMKMVLWRGMKNVRPTDEFITEGCKCIISL